MLEIKPYVKFIEYKKRDLSGYKLIEGFPGMGLVGTIAAKYIIEKMKLPQYGYIDSNFFLPIIRVHKGIPVNPSRIYIDTKRKLLVLLSEQIIPRQYTAVMAHSVVNWIKEKKIKEVISLSGIHAEPGAGKANAIYGISSCTKDIKMLKKHGLELIENGITTGITALMLLDLGNEKICAYSIMGNVKTAADYQAAVSLIKKLNEILGLKVEVAPLLKEAKKTEQEIIGQLKKLQKTTDSTDKFEPQSPIRTPMYT